MTGKVEVPADRERVWRDELEPLVGTDEIRTLSRQSVADSIFAIVLLWVEVAVLFVAANLLPHLPLGWAITGGVILVGLLGTRVMALGVIVHEGSHGLLAKSRRLNDRLCNWGASFWIINSVEEYRPTHRLHHRYLDRERDPDRHFYVVPARRGALAKLVLLDLVGATAFRRATTRISGTSEVSAAPASFLTRPQLLAGKLITQAVIVGQFIVFLGPLLGVVFYAVFWLVPIACLYPMLIRVKTITEHYDPRLRNPNEACWTARTSFAGMLQNHVVGARMEFHFEHHVFPTIPYRGLKKLHRRFNQSGLFSRHGELLSDGYVLFLARAVAGKLS